jgi:hypothetical protein
MKYFTIRIAKDTHVPPAHVSAGHPRQKLSAIESVAFRSFQHGYLLHAWPCGAAQVTRAQRVMCSHLARCSIGVFRTCQVRAEECGAKAQSPGCVCWRGVCCLMVYSSGAMVSTLPSPSVSRATESGLRGRVMGSFAFVGVRVLSLGASGLGVVRVRGSRCCVDNAQNMTRGQRDPCSLEMRVFFFGRHPREHQTPGTIAALAPVVEAGIEALAGQQAAEAARL